MRHIESKNSLKTSPKVTTSIRILVPLMISLKDQLSLI